VKQRLSKPEDVSELMGENTEVQKLIEPLDFDECEVDDEGADDGSALFSC